MATEAVTMATEAVTMATETVTMATVPLYGHVCVPDTFPPVCTLWSMLDTQTARLQCEWPEKEQLSKEQLIF